jgi:hypothetical protein
MVHFLIVAVFMNTERDLRLTDVKGNVVKDVIAG